MKESRTLYIIQGFIGAGKSTYSAKLAERTKAIHLNPDKIVTEMFKKDEYMNNWESCFDKALDFMWKNTIELLNQNKSVILDMGFWKKNDREYARGIAKQLGVKLEHIYLSVPDEVLKERIRTTRPAEWVKIHLDNFEKNKLNFEEPDATENYTTINNY